MGKGKSTGVASYYRSMLALLRNGTFHLTTTGLDVQHCCR